LLYPLRPPTPLLVPYTTLFRSRGDSKSLAISEHIFDILGSVRDRKVVPLGSAFPSASLFPLEQLGLAMAGYLRHLDPHDTVESLDRKSTRLNSSHVKISYAVFC